jgi:hypothetical protein
MRERWKALNTQMHERNRKKNAADDIIRQYDQSRTESPALKKIKQRVERLFRHDATICDPRSGKLKIEFDALVAEIPSLKLSSPQKKELVDILGELSAEQKKPQTIDVELAGRLSQYQRFFKMVGDVGERHIVAGKTARELIDADKLISRLLHEATPESLAQAEAQMRQLAEKYLGGTSQIEEEAGANLLQSGCLIYEVFHRGSMRPERGFRHHLMVYLGASLVMGRAKTSTGSARCRLTRSHSC